MDQIHVVNAEIKALIESCACACVCVKSECESGRWGWALVFGMPRALCTWKGKRKSILYFLNWFFTSDDVLQQQRRSLLCSRDPLSNFQEGLGLWGGGVSENILRPPRHPLKSGDLWFLSGWPRGARVTYLHRPLHLAPSLPQLSE